MPRFRSKSVDSPLVSRPVNPDGILEVIDEAFRPEHLFLSTPDMLGWFRDEHEELTWEIFRGRLLDPAHTRERAAFRVWKAYLETEGQKRPDVPLLAIHWDESEGRLHIVRGVESYVWEGYTEPDADNVYLSRERRKWVRELVGTIHLERMTDLEELLDELRALLFFSVVGLSRLPLTSVEAPLPGFCLGGLLYCPREGGQSLHDSRSLFLSIHEIPTPRERARALEAFLRGATSEEIASLEASELGLVSDEAGDLLRRIYNEASLSPWTQLVDRTIDFTRALMEHGLVSTESIVDFWSLLLRQVGRHLHAYDLVTFHHRGANYPDALLLDAVLEEYLRLLRESPELAEGDVPRAGRRRRALRSAWLQRRRYEGHLVPDAPTSPGENNRVLPDHPRVPEEQILQPASRTRKLFDDSETNDFFDERTRPMLERSLDDLDHEDELLELGMALFLDRPLGYRKPPMEPDQTPMLASLAFSNAVARDSLGRLVSGSRLAELEQRLEALDVSGYPLSRVGGASRPGGVRLVDAHHASRDFVFLRTLPGSLRTFFEMYDLEPVFDAAPGLRDAFERPMFLTETTLGTLQLFDGEYRPLLEIEPAGEFVIRAGIELPSDGLVVHVVESNTSPIDGGVVIELTR